MKRSVSGEKNKISEVFKNKKKLLIIVSLLVIISVIVFVVLKPSGKKTDVFSQMIANDVVTRGTVEETISGSAVVEPYERYEIISLVSGDILSSPFEVGDSVLEGDLLYEIDKSSISLSIEKQQLNLEQSRDNYNEALEDADKLKITAPCSGVISGIDIKVGDDVQPSTLIGKIENTYDLEVVIPFNSSQVANISVGDSATISSSLYMSSVSGTVTHIEKNATPQPDGSMLHGVTIEFKNPGAFMKGVTVGGEINGMISPGYGTIESENLKNVNPEVNGEVKTIHVRNGDFVNEGDLLVTLTSDTVTKSIKNSSLQYRSSSLSLEETMENLNDYSLTSPINGTVITKNYKTGDTIDRNSNSQTLMVVADISKLKFTLLVDELDISKVAVGQDVKISCDALEGEEYLGKITNVSVEGTSTNGVTVYEAEVVIEEPGNLRPSMNIDATVVFALSENTLMVPSGDIKTVMGKSYVFKKETGDDKSSDTEQKKDYGKQIPENDMKNTVGKAEDRNVKAKGEKGFEGKGPGSMMPEAPEGYVTVEVTIGLTNNEYTEILSGLSEGDEIYRITTASSSNRFGMMMGGMGGGMPQGSPGGMGGMR